MNKLTEKAKKISCLITDVDGVLTNGFIYLDPQGNELKAFHVQDGMGIKMLLAAGIQVAVITTSVSNIIEERMKQLGISLFYTGQVDKRDAFQQLKAQLSLSNEDIAYIGDDLPDLPIIQEVGLGVAVQNAVPQVREYADWVSAKDGGAGAVRELCDLILYSQGLFDTALEKYFKS